MLESRPIIKLPPIPEEVKGDMRLYFEQMHAAIAKQAKDVFVDLYHNKVIAETVVDDAITAAKIDVTDLVDVANLLTVASGKITIGADVIGAGLHGIVVNDGTHDRVQMGEISDGAYGLTVKDASGNVTINLGKLTGESDKKNLVVKVNASHPTYQIDVDAAHLKLDDSTLLLESINLTVDITASGVNGLDTGSEANNTWYSIWVIHNPTTATTAGLFSTSTASPTMPTGYTKKRRVGWVRNDDSGNFRKFYMVGNWWYWDDVYLVLDVTNPLPTEWTDVGCSSVSPPTARMLMLCYTVIDTNDNGAFFYLRRNGGGAYVSLGTESRSAAIVYDRLDSSIFLACDEDQKFEYRSLDAGVDILSINVVGYHEPI